MNVLIITGDRRFGPGNPRFELQKSAVGRLEVVYWGRGSMWPAIPEGPFGVVSAQDPFMRGLFAWYVARSLKAKFNVQVHADLSGQSFFKHILAQIILSHADSIRVVSESIRTQVERVGVKAPTAVLPIYIDVSKFTGITRNPERMVLWVGRFEKEKDPMLALKVIKDVPNATLIMLGEGSMLSVVKEKARELPVEFSGWQDPVPYYSRAGAVLSTSPYESFGASIVEALAAGVPVVSLDVGAAKEAGAIVVPKPRLAEAVKEALDSGRRGELKFKLHGKEEWVRAWQNTL